MFAQILNPTGSLGLTVVAALVPLAALLFLLAVLRVTAWLATLIGSLVTIVLAVLVWRAPLGGTLSAYLYGALQGTWVIDWITFWGLVIFNTLVLTGTFDRFKNWILAEATADIRVQTILLAWSFGALLEGLVGFGYPWSVVAPILVGIGISDLEAIRVAALANNAPVSYGALGAPILALGAVTQIDPFILSASVGKLVAILALLPPWILIYLVSGRQGLREAWPLAVVASLSYIAGQYPVSQWVGPFLPDLTGSLVSFWVLYAFLRLWRPRVVRGFGGLPIGAGGRPVTVVAGAAPAGAGAVAVDPPDPPASPRGAREALVAWLPYIVLIVVVVAWTGPWSHLPSFSLFKLSTSALSSVTHKEVASAFSFTPLNGGTAILASWLVITAILRPSARQLGQVFARTFRQMWGALLVAFFIFGLAYVFNYSGMAASLAYSFARVGPAFVVLAPILGWVGVALSGSNTSTNAMFGQIQTVAGSLLHFPPLLLPSLNSVGSEIGKPVAPQTASVGVSTSRLVRNEGEVIRHNMGWTLVLLAYLILIGLFFRYVAPGAMQL
ncbi:MAG: L-lactate permease [Clostridia bacterium]|nr:L-lactate permease [Clostridia bacterium]MCL6521507.1 L-lactate permease [Bacillota bacterium]